MTRGIWDEITEMWAKINDTSAIITLFKNIEDGGYICTDKDKVYIPPEVIKKILPVLWKYRNQLDKEFEEL